MPEVAQAQALKWRHQASKKKLSDLTVIFVEYALSLKWSPEQIAGVSKIIELPVSHEWIYFHIQKDKLNGGQLYKQLRHGHRKYRKGLKLNEQLFPIE
ncbi:hypothetical protein N476_05740 [Pseudoalteromonas luteoviolacea H33]|uniref:Uncharacterized protein n=1 Tax=Pseudoalteromonas luteoviolacea H33 TaxID=1365251 RepID=A0A166ZNI0_9GAMM|nr:hypothetical protein N476_05740 [Pseudoalteromonas luteoviolacea H33]KZN78515.1 hypothetical protein N477_08930 [Pseudoalteromonas luteoviolacea H33-S]